MSTLFNKHEKANELLAEINRLSMKSRRLQTMIDEAPNANAYLELKNNLGVSIAHPIDSAKCATYLATEKALIDNKLNKLKTEYQTYL